MPLDARGKDTDDERLMIRDDVRSSISFNFLSDIFQELKARLVDRVPQGAKLTAIFDSCHSATLLGVSQVHFLSETITHRALVYVDLEHSHCNRVYIPHVSKGQHRSRSLWNQNVRKNALISNRTVYQNRRVSTSLVELHSVLRGSETRADAASQSVDDLLRSGTDSHIFHNIF